MNPRCEYCNQPRFPAVDDFSVWRRAIAEATEDGARPGTLVYLTGGEPLDFGEELYGPDGLVAFAAQRGAVVNVNTNAVQMTPEVALQLLAAGVARLHISFDSSHPDIQNSFVGGEPVFDRIITGLYNVQIARDLLGADPLTIHLNCVLTNRNLATFPDLFQFLLERKKRAAERGSVEDGKRLQSDELAVHVIPVGGARNAPLRPSAAEFKRFHTEILGEVGALWNAAQAEAGIPENERLPVGRAPVFTSQYGDLDEYAERAAEGVHSELGLGERCYIAPTQAFLRADGGQHWCGAHVNYRGPFLGYVQEGGLKANIRANMGDFTRYPDEHCRNCARATVTVNGLIQGMLQRKIEEWQKEGSLVVPPSGGPDRRGGASLPAPSKLSGDRSEEGDQAGKE
jgi:sulfatase maturation enzyme AslB (radical SAM superfamily)